MDLCTKCPQDDISRFFGKQLRLRSDNRLLSMLCHLVFILMYFSVLVRMKRHAEGLFSQSGPHIGPCSYTSGLFGLASHAPAQLGELPTPYWSHATPILPGGLAQVVQQPSSCLCFPVPTFPGIVQVLQLVHQLKPTQPCVTIVHFFGYH